MASHSYTKPHRRRIVGVSTKLYFTLSQTQKYVHNCISPSHEISSLAHTYDIDIFIIPDLLSLYPISQILFPPDPTSTKLSPNTSATSTGIQLGAPDCFWEDSGPYTGEVSPKVLRGLGVSIVELGHAERRRLFGETDEHVALKAKAAVRNGMVPLVCIGEVTRGTVEQAVNEVQSQVCAVLRATCGQKENAEVVFAYEPVWAIGQQESASADYVVSVVTSLRMVCKAMGRGEEVRFIYGGSAGLGTFEGMKEAVDGLFLGRFAHDVEQFRKIIREIGSA